MEVRIVNGAYQGGIEVDEAAHPTAADVVVQAVKGGSRWVIAREWARIALGTAVRAADHYLVQAREVLIETTPPYDIAVDGEVITRTPARIAVSRNALFVMAPGRLRRPSLNGQGVSALAAAGMTGVAAGGASPCRASTRPAALASVRRWP